MCKFKDCDKRTTKGYCFKHNPENAEYNSKRYKEYQERQKSKIEEYITQIAQLNGQI